MKVARILRFGPPNVITYDDLPRPEPAAEQLLVRVKAPGVGKWDAFVREGKIPHEPSPFILGYELSGIVEATGAEVAGSRLATKYMGRLTINSPEITQNMRCLCELVKTYN